MDTLHAFLSWFETEKPGRLPGAELSRLSENAKTALSYAAEQVCRRDSTCHGVEGAIQRYPAQVSRLSLALCAALDEMCGGIPGQLRCDHAALKVDQDTGRCWCAQCGTILLASSGRASLTPPPQSAVASVESKQEAG